MDTGNFSEKIIEFLDGELPQTEEESLFVALSVNEELRNIFKEHLAISRSVRSDFNSFIPPASAFENIAKVLEFKTIGNVGSSSKPFFFSKYGKTALLMLSTAILTFLLTYLFFRPEGDSYTQFPKAIIQTPPIVIASIESNSLPEFSGNSQQVLSSKGRKSPIKILEVSDQRNYTKFDQSFTDSFENLLVEPTEYEKVDKVENFNSTLTQTNQLMNVLLKSHYENVDLSSRLNFGINFRGIAAKTFPNPNVETSNTFLNNISLGLYFTQWDNIKFGIEFGKEVFGLSYTNEINGVQFAYEHKPALLWGAVGIDYSLPYSFYYFQPFVTFLAGGTQIGGPLIKGIGGVRYRPLNSNLELYLGAEGTMLLYQNQKIYYLTKKIGLTYGISVIF